MAKQSRQQRSVENISRLHKDYARGELSLLIGAGVSIPSGFPSWDALNQRLLLLYVRSEHEADKLSAPLLPKLASQLYELFGRDSSAEFVRLAAGHAFESMLAEALYGGRSLEELPITSLQYQLAAMSRRCRTTTLNFEPMLELARAHLDRTLNKDLVWRSLRAVPKRDQKPQAGKIEHLHGWLDPDGSASSTLVLTEKHYFDLSDDASATVNARLEALLTQDGAVLTVGLSWADYNLRRMLYHLLRRSNGAKIFTILREDDVVLEDYAAQRWGSLNLIPIFVKEFDAVPSLLRDVAWGMAPEGALPNWLARSVQWREQIAPDDVIFSDEWQTVAFGALGGLVKQLCVLFGVKTEERLNVGLFLPMKIGDTDIHLHQVASSRRERSAEQARALAARRALGLRRGSEQGAAGISFVVGNNRQVLHGEPGIDTGFSAEMKESWLSRDSPYRDWRSLLCIPILDSEDWLPVAVVTLTSNFSAPFWTELDRRSELQAELFTLMRKTGRWLINEGE